MHQTSTTSQITLPAHASRPRLPSFLRSVSPAAVAVTVSLLIGGAGFADAATGGTFILGKANREASTASLADSKGTPLALSAPHGKPPLAVNRNVMVKNLNAQYLGGLTATGLAATGGEGVTAPGTNTPLSSNGPTVVARTGKLPTGTYYVIATANVSVAPGDRSVFCWIATGSEPGVGLNEGLATESAFTVSETAAVTVTAGDTLLERCIANGTNGSFADDAGILAIRVLSSSHH